MSHYRRAAKVDKNQEAIVAALRQIPGVTVALRHDDLLVGYKGLNYWYELKSSSATNKKGVVYKSKIKQSQQKIRDTWTGHYEIAASIKFIINDMDIDEQWVSILERFIENYESSRTKRRASSAG